jgi:hypothetical protein
MKAEVCRAQGWKAAAIRVGKVGKYIYILWYAEESYETLRIEI